jgi:hypothetical protein
MLYLLYSNLIILCKAIVLLLSFHMSSSMLVIRFIKLLSCIIRVTNTISEINVKFIGVSVSHGIYCTNYKLFAWSA